jgi:hypothetical protein
MISQALGPKRNHIGNWLMDNHQYNMNQLLFLGHHFILNVVHQHHFVSQESLIHDC